MTEENKHMPPQDTTNSERSGDRRLSTCSSWLCRESHGMEYLLYLGAETKPEPLTRSGRQTWKWGNGFENLVIFTPKEWAKISPLELEPGDGPIPVAGGFFAMANAYVKARHK